MNRRFLGNLDAASDKRFEDHFIDSLDLARIDSRHSDIVYGSKGAGKTALRRALTELKKPKFYTTKTINLDQISFSEVHVALSILKESSSIEIATLARNIWCNVLAMYCLEAVAESLDHGHGLKREITELLHKENFLEDDSNNRLIGFIERLFIKIANSSLEKAIPSPLGLSKEQRHLINSFPSSPIVKNLLEKSSGWISATNKVALICLDGFDSIVDHTPESRKAIFAGLIDAIHKCSRDPLLADAFCFKAFLPQELTDTAHTIIWDEDKFIQRSHYLRWSASDFEKFLRARLAPYAKTKSIDFIDIWQDFMPDKVHNDSHRIDEPSLGYILRHTLYRPRQILAHLQEILDCWDEVSNKFKIDPSFIPPIVAKTNHKLAGSVVNQLEVTYPGLSIFMQSWSGSPNVVSVREFHARMKRFLQYSGSETNSIFDVLFNFGVFGISRKSNTSRGMQQTRFRFAFVGNSMIPNIHAVVDEFDLLAFSPMFHEYCGCIPSKYGAIIPTDRFS